MKILGGLVIAVVVLLVGLGLFLPKEFSVEREIIINQPKSVVYDFVKLLKNGGKWDPWSKKDPNMIKEYRGVDGEIGAVASWAGNDEVGVGEQEIKNAIPGERIDFELRFKEPWEDSSNGYYIFEAAGENQTKLKWSMTGKSPFPFNIMCFFMNMNDMVGKDFDEGLANLKRILETP